MSPYNNIVMSVEPENLDSSTMDTQLPRTTIPGLKPPAPLTLGHNISDAWKLFRQRWTTYCVLTQLQSLPSPVQVALFLHCLDDDALRTYNGFTFDSLESERTVDEIIAKFDSFAIGELNETYERYVFNNRSQREDETFESFLSELQRLVKSCNYCDKCVDSILRDRIVLGVRDKDTQKELLKSRGLTLAKSVDLCKAAETANLQRVLLNNPPHDAVSTIRKKGFNDNKPDKSPVAPARSPPVKTCKYCNQQHQFLKSKCPAYGKVCSKCNGYNHFASVCRRGKKMYYVDEMTSSRPDSPEPTDLEWINTLKPTNGKLVKCRMILNQQSVPFLIDSGAAVNVIPEKFATDTKPHYTRLQIYGGENIDCIGKSTEYVTNPKNKMEYKVEFVVCKKNVQPILGLQTAQTMKLLRLQHNNFVQVNTINSSVLNHPAFNEGLGQFPGTQTLQTDPAVKPVIMPDRRVPISVRDQLKRELDKLTNQNVIAPVTEPTPWVSQTVVAKKKNGDLRICIDPKYLNKALLRERYTMPLLDDVLHELSQSTFFTKVDLRNGFWHVLLDDESSKLTTFQTCFGRYRWLRLPFGLSVSPEIFQRKVLELFGGKPGVVAVHDDIIIHGKDRAEHDKRLEQFLRDCELYNVKLNKDKLELASSSITFMGHIISDKGISTDPEKVKAIKNFPVPKSVTEVRRFLGMVQYLARYIPHLTDALHPIQNLTKKDTPFVWSSSQESAFLTIKKTIAESPQLSIYDESKELTIENDASEYGLGSVLLQEGKPLAFASRTLSECEKNYAQIEKELLAITFGLKKFHNYTYGRQVTVVTDHKPLVSITNKPLVKAPKRLQSLLLKIQDYDISLIYKTGSQLVVSDSLSRAPLPETENDYTCNNLMDTPFKPSRLDEIKASTVLDPTLNQLKLVILQGWPDLREEVPPSTLPYFPYRDELTVQDGIILRGDRVVIPTSLRRDMLLRVHAGHHGINSCLRRARELIFWPGMSQEIRAYVESCDTCATFSHRQPEQPLKTHEVPARPWQKVGTDIFTLKGRSYLVTVDYFSSFIELDYLLDLNSVTVIHKLKHHFARHGIPEVLISDNGTQFTSGEFIKFTKEWCFRHERITPGNSKANGAAEAAVKIVKNIMIKCHKSNEDPYLGILNLRNTPNEGLSTSPAQRLMGRRTQTILPTSASALAKSSPISENERKNMDKKKFKMSQKNIHRTPLHDLSVGDKVRMEPINRNDKEWKSATVTKTFGNNNFEVFDGVRFFRRNRQLLRRQKSHNNMDNVQATPHNKTHTQTLSTQKELQSSIIPSENFDNVTPNDTVEKTPLTTRSGRIVKPPDKLVVLPGPTQKY